MTKTIHKKLILCLAVIWTAGLNAQTVYENYVDGSIYFKIKDDVELGVNLEDGAKDIANPEVFPFFEELDTKFKVRSLIRPFITYDNNPKLNRIYHLSFGDYRNVDNIIRTLEKFEQIEYAHKEILAHYDDFIGNIESTENIEQGIEGAELTPNDPEYGKQWHLTKINAPGAWDIAAGGDVLAVIVDLGFQTSHPDLKNNLFVNPKDPVNGADDDGDQLVDDVNGWNFVAQPSPGNNNINPPSGVGGDPNDSWHHGTHTMGLVGATANNSTGVAGVGYNVKIAGVRAYTDQLQTSAGIWYNGMVYAYNKGAKVVSLSVGVPDAPSATMTQIVDALYAKGITMVAAAGNGSNSAKNYPAALDKVIAVAATGQTDKKQAQTTYGTWIDVSAPGENIYSTIINGYGYMTGSSQACPITAGVVALMYAANPAIGVTDVKQCLQSTAVNIDAQNPGFSGQLGAGRIDAQAAVSCAKNLNVKNDMGVVSIVAPTGNICGDVIPKVELKNFGTSVINSAVLKYRIDNQAELSTGISGPVQPGESGVVTLKAITGVANGNHTFTATIESPNGQTDADNSNDSKTSSFSMCTTGIEDLQASDRINVYPNPAEGFVFAEISLEKSADLTLKVFNEVGQSVKEELRKNWKEGSLKLDLSDIPAGIYFIEINTGSGIYNKKLVLK